MASEDGFLSRWARRKADVRQGKPLEEPVPPKPAPVLARAQVPAGPGVRDADRPVGVDADSGAPLVAAEPPPLTLEDAQALTQQSDFKPFMARQVQPDVRNAAMKKLFSDPHYNVMDGLDIYIDDYTKSDPIPESMLRQMVGAQFLKLFDHELDPAPTAPRDISGGASPASVAQCTEPSNPRLSPDHANTHLRLQPDHAPAGPDSGSNPA